MKMRALGMALALAAAPALAAGAEGEPDKPGLFASGGVGMGELLHAEVGYFLTERWAVEGRFGNVLFNPMYGVGATRWIGLGSDRETPRHALLVSAQAMVNPTTGPASFGDVIGSSLGGYVGYGFLSDPGFFVRGLAGGIVYWDDGPAAGPNVTISVGWALR